MPQTFQVLRCYKCLVFQVHQTKKSNKFQCKLCGEKQSIKRHYGIGTAKDCRGHVQKLNVIRGEIDELKETKNLNLDSDDTSDEINNEIETTVKTKKPCKSKWLDYVYNSEEINEADSTEKLYLDNTEVVFELPKRRKRNNFKCPVRNPIKEESEHFNNCENVDDAPLHEQTFFSNTEKYKLETNNSAPTNFLNIDTHTKNKEDDSLPLEVKKTNIIGFDNPVPKAYVKAPTNSKWAQFVEQDEENVCSDNSDDDITPNKSTPNDEVVTNSQNLFALCGDSDLDNVLDL